MTVFKYFWKIIITRKTSILLMTGIFMILNIFFVQNAEEVSEVNASESTIAIIDQDNSRLSIGLTSYLEERHTLMELENNEAVLQDALFFGQVTYILIIPDGFENDFITSPKNARLENLQAPDSFVGVFIDNQIEDFLVLMNTYLSADFEMNRAIENTMADLNLGVEVEVLQGRIIDNSMFHFQFLAYFFLAVVTVAISPIFFTFNKKDLARRNDCSSLSMVNRNMQITLGCAIAAVGLWLASFIPMFIFHGNEVFTTVTLFRAINSLALLTVALGIAFLLGNLLGNDDVLQGASNIIALGLSFLTGVFVPQEFLGSQILMVARFLPTYWYVRGNTALSGMVELSGEVARMFWEGLLIQLGFAVVLFAVTLVIIKQKKTRAVV